MMWRNCFRCASPACGGCGESATGTCCGSSGTTRITRSVRRPRNTRETRGARTFGRPLEFWVRDDERRWTKTGAVAVGGEEAEDRLLEAVERTDQAGKAY